MGLRSFAVAYMLYIATNVPVYVHVHYNEVLTRKKEDRATMAVRRKTELIEGAASSLSLRGQ